MKNLLDHIIWCTSDSILLFLKCSSPLSSGPYAYTCLCFTDVFAWQTISISRAWTCWQWSEKTGWRNTCTHARYDFGSVPLKKQPARPRATRRSWTRPWHFFSLPQQAFEAQAKERINYLRNMVWTHLNQLSQQCVTSDEVKRHRTSQHNLLQCAFFWSLLSCFPARFFVAVRGGQEVAGAVWCPERRRTLCEPPTDWWPTAR